MEKEEIIDDLIELMNQYIAQCESEGRSFSHTVNPLIEKYGLELVRIRQTHQHDTFVRRKE